MTQEFARLYYRLALKQAKNSNLTGAIEYLQISLTIDNKNEKALKLMDLCLYERDKIDMPLKGLSRPLNAFGPSGGTNYLKDVSSQNLTPLKLNKAISAIGALPHKSVRALNILGCLYAIKGNYNKSSQFFALALEKDRGNILASKSLTHVSVKNGFFRRNYEKLLRIIRN